MFNNKLKKKISDLEEELTKLKEKYNNYSEILDIDTELDLLEKERDELVETIEKLKESKKTKFRIVEKDEYVFAERMRIENGIVLFENSKISEYFSLSYGWKETLDWNIVASCKSDLTVIKI